MVLIDNFSIRMIKRILCPLYTNQVALSAGLGGGLLTTSAISLSVVANPALFVSLMRPETENTHAHHPLYSTIPKFGQESPVFSGRYS
jgi:hypothetical protein